MNYVVLAALLVAASSAQEKYKLCAPDWISDATCNAVQRGESRIACLRVTDSADCAIRLSRGEADFGVFTAEEALLAYQFYPNEILPMFQQRHKDRAKEEFEFQSVVVIPTSLQQELVGKGLAGLKNAGFCHPGFSKAQWWNDYILKYFERTTYDYKCAKDLTAAENEATNLKSFFGQACRPGEWVADTVFDSYLKKTYPELCALCDDTVGCKYTSKEDHGHKGALECLTSGRGKVAYAALSHVRQYIKANDSYQFLCPDGSVAPLTNETPCAWIRQPWSVIAARKERAADLAKDLGGWLAATGSEQWKISLSKILQEDSVLTPIVENVSLGSYLLKGRSQIDLPTVHSCGNEIRWCTINDDETKKCQWVAKEALALGIEPRISCKQAVSTFQCFRDIAENKADIITIDSNYGHLARKVYNLGTVLHCETENDRNSMVVAVVRVDENGEQSMKGFQQLKGSTACFPEYGGIAWLSFVMTARTNRIISSKSCNYPKLVGNLLSGACTPGIQDSDHSNTTVHASVLNTDFASSLCSKCPLESGTTLKCSANKNNAYYGDKGALQCLGDAAGDIAFIEARNLIDGTVDPNRYQILCRNNSLALRPGFNFDEFCALSVTIDSEIVGRKNNTHVVTLDTTLALLKIEDWLGYRVDARRPIRIYDKFNGIMDLLFKDTTSGLVNTTSTIKSVIAYKELFSHVEACSGAIVSVSSSFSIIALLVSFLFVWNQM